MTQKEFLEKVAPVIVKVAKKRGYQFPSAIIAQAACESAWGKSKLSSKYHNYFGMKCGTGWIGESVNLSTKEETTQGVLESCKSNFRVYYGLEEGIEGYFSFIESYARYSNLKYATSPEDYIQKIKADGWATSSTYVNTLTNILTKHDLKKYDTYVTTVSNEGEITDNERAIAKDVISGKYGNGMERKDNIYKAVQRAVNEALHHS